MLSMITHTQPYYQEQPVSDTLAALGLFDEDADPDFRVVTATVTQATPDVALLRTHSGESAIMPITEFYPNKRWTEGATYSLLRTDAGPRPTLSAVRPELVGLLLAGLSPEVRDGQVRIMGIARGVGVRTKLAVAATCEDVDPIAAVVGRAANRVNALRALLQGERVDMVPWNPDREVFLRNALGPSRFTSIEIEENRARVVVPAHQHAAVVGGGGLNAALAGRLVGLSVSVEVE